MPRVAPRITLDSTTESTLQYQAVASVITPRLALRSRIILAAAKGKSNQQIAAALSIPLVTVGKWRRLFAEYGLEALRDAPRSGRPGKRGREVWQRVQTRVCQQPGLLGRWSVRTLAREVRLPRSTLHGMLVACHLEPHRLATSTVSPDLKAKLLDIVGLYLDPPENALVLSVDANTGVEALDRNQRVLPLRATKPRRRVNKYARHGAQTLLGAIRIATGQDLAKAKQGRTSMSFLNFMDDVVTTCPGADLHVILDQTHTNPAAQHWLGRHPRVRFHRSSTHGSWVNRIEGLFRTLRGKGHSQAVHRCKVDLMDFLSHIVAQDGQTCFPFHWTRGPEKSTP